MSDILYLSRLLLSPRSRQARSEIANPYELHRTLSRAFSGINEKAWDGARCLFRVEEEITDRDSSERVVPVLVQTRLRPDWAYQESLPGYLSGNVEIKQIPFRRANDNRLLIPAGIELSFRLVANPTVKREGKRIGIYSEADRLTWMERKAEESGFRVIDLRLIDRGMVRCRTSGNEQAVFSAVQFDGTLIVTDAEQFGVAWSGGIGAGKGIGFGLISVARKKI